MTPKLPKKRRKLRCTIAVSPDVMAQIRERAKREKVTVTAIMDEAARMLLTLREQPIGELRMYPGQIVLKRVPLAIFDQAMDPPAPTPEL